MTKVKYGFPKILFIAVLAVLSACNPQKPSSDFSLAFGPATLNLAAGATGSSTVALTPIGGFDTTQKVSAVAIDGTAYGTNNSQIQVGDAITIDDTHASFSFVAGSSIAAGAYDLNFKFTIGTLQRSAKITIKVTATATVANPTNFVATSSADGTSIDVS